MKNDTKDLPILHLTSPEEWEAWLDLHHETSSGIWMKFAKKGSGNVSISYAQAVEGALCYGWIDGQTASFDAKFWLQRFTRRSRRSKWSKINCAKATALIEDGRMKNAGLREIEAARLDGRWDRAYASPATITIPEDLQEKLDEHPEAGEFFAQLDSKNRYAILYRIHDAKKPETRARRIATFITMLRERKTLH